MLSKFLATAAVAYYANATTIGVENGNFTCDLDQNIVYNFTATESFIRKATVGTSANCEYTISTNALDNFYRSSIGTYKLTVPNTCLVDNSNGNGKNGEVKLYFSRSLDQNLYVGNTVQTLTCNLTRQSSVDYDFTSISLASTAGGDESHGNISTNQFQIQRQNNSGFDSENTSDVLTSGQLVYFKISPVDALEGIQFEVSKCKVGKAGAPDYVLFDLYDNNTCVETFLSTQIEKTASGDWHLTYTGFTFATDNDSNVVLSCDLLLCHTANEAELNGGFCKKDQVNMACGSDTGLVDSTVVPHHVLTANMEVHYETIPETWGCINTQQQAREKCEMAGGFLPAPTALGAVMHIQGTDDFKSDSAKCNFRNVKGFWTQISDTATEDVFTYQDGTIVEEIYPSFRQWFIVGQPDDGGSPIDNEDCLMTHKHGGLNDVPCDTADSQQGTVCAFKNGETGNWA